MAEPHVQQQATVVIEVTPGSPPIFPDYLLNPDAVLKDEATWRFGKVPDYSNTRRVFADTKKMNHAEGSLEHMIQNLVKNWEIEASFKTNLSDWRTIDRDNYTFVINGEPPQDAEHMLKVGTFNAIIAPNSYYSSDYSNFSQSHQTFKRMMPTFAWEVLEVYSGPPRAVFKWRHWGQMKNNYIGCNDKGEKITAKAHGGILDIQGVTVAMVNDRLHIKSLETFFDPFDMFRQFTPKDINVAGEHLSKQVLIDLPQGNEGMEAIQALAEPVEIKPPTSMDEVDVSSPDNSYHMIQKKQETTTIDAAVRADESRVGKPSLDAEHRSNSPGTELAASDRHSVVSLPPGYHEASLKGGGSSSCPFLPASYSLRVTQASNNTPQDSAITELTHDMEEKTETTTARQPLDSATSEILLSRNVGAHLESVSAAVEGDSMNAQVVPMPTQPETHEKDLVCAASTTLVDTGNFLLSEHSEVRTEDAVSKADWSTPTQRTFHPDVTSPDPNHDDHTTQQVAEGKSAFAECHKDVVEPLETK